ncbi:MAG: sigma-B regulation protein RsbU (phosphoserine phosphatase) [Patiriisocius sp.]|jgi:sigma-B regulation protein RsbU (phosphoserine phosphatase)
MIQIGTVQIHNDNSIVQCRNKIRVLSLDLDFSPVVATRIATATSEICSILLQSNSHSSVKIAFDKIDERLGLLMVFDPATRQLEEKNFNLLFDHFEFVSDNQGKEQIKAFKFFSNLNFIPSQNFIEAAKGKLLELSRDELEKALEKANERMRGELNIAKDIQMSMLPLTFPAYPQRKDFDIFATLKPAREVGGDFYDFFFIDEEHLCFVIGDVSGKGVPAALMMAVCKTLLKSRAGSDKSTASILTHVNNEMAQDNKNYMFVTVFMAILNTSTGELTYSNAGHNPTYIKRKNGEIEKLTTLHGPVIAAMEGVTYGETQVSLKKNDIVLAYTDGVTESQNIKEELYSDAKFEALLQNGDYDSSKSLTDLIIESVKEFEGEADQFDDITVMALEYFKDADEATSANSSLKIKNELKEITTAIEWFEAFSMENKMPFKIIQKINIAFDELLNNIISYGYKDDDIHEIYIKIELRNERLIFVISDDGIPFNPFSDDSPITTLSVDEREIGGLGIHIVKNLMDEYEYKRNVDMNVVTLIKYDINQ